MAESQTLDILGQIQALVSDKLQVVSYKWLSRNFSVSSNNAKRLLQEFVDKHGNELEVIYTLSGWLKNNPQIYHIRLSSGLKLPEVKEEFEDNCSVQVYSVQACIPMDLAVLWSAEFVQAEELFDQPSTAENCLRDNRFCGVSNSFVKRTVDGKPVIMVPLHPKNSLGVAVQAKTSNMLENPSAQPPQQGRLGQPSATANYGVQSSTVVTTGGKNDKIAPEVIDQTSKSHLDKESITVVHANKRKGQNEKTSSATGSSLANLWGRASTKSKPLSPAIDTTNDVPTVAVTAEAQICAREAADAVSSDDDGQGINCKRTSNGGNSKKRRVIIDFSDDDEEEENVVSLASPDLPNRQPVPDSIHNTGNVVPETKSSKFEEQKADMLEVKEDNIDKRSCRLLLNDDISCGGKSNTAETPMQKKTQSHIPEGFGDKHKEDKVTNSGSTSPQRRKVLKTRIDERGREVTEVVWEGVAADSNSTDKTLTTNGAKNRPPVASKALSAATNVPSNPVSKAGNKKTTKGGGKDVKQGNILSFFKKV